MKTAKGSTTGALIVILIVFLGGLSGCASLGGGQQTLSRDTEYRRILELQKHKATLAAAEESEQKIPDATAEGAERLGDQHMRQGNLSMAFLQYYKSLRLDPERGAVRHKVGVLLLSRGMTDEADKEFDEMLRHRDCHDLAYEGKGRVSLARNEPEKAVANFQKALEINKTLWQAKAYLGIIYDRQKRYDAAIREYEEAVELNPNTSILFNNLGLSYLHKGEYPNAVDAFIKALRHDPENSLIYNNLGLALFKTGRHQQSFEAFKKAGGEPAAYNNIGCLHMAEGEYDRARQAFAMAIEKRPSYYVKAHENMNRVTSAVQRAETDPTTVQAE
ncbi:MAG TPA: tetratricopeptide repeat protein [Syntrophales bacterium]|jgi:Flp pilus assembly protein TadD|nr:tetratricopeptide repeat protein [Syntrophales bacterium]